VSGALTQIIPVNVRPEVTMATGVAVVVILAWAIVPLVAGAPRTRMRGA
jgi:hypothetical protein